MIWHLVPHNKALELENAFKISLATTKHGDIYYIAIYFFTTFSTICLYLTKEKKENLQQNEINPPNNFDKSNLLFRICNGTIFLRSSNSQRPIVSNEWGNSDGLANLKEGKLRCSSQSSHRAQDTARFWATAEKGSWCGEEFMHFPKPQRKGHIRKDLNSDLSINSVFSPSKTKFKKLERKSKEQRGEHRN